MYAEVAGERLELIQRLEHECELRQRTIDEFLASRSAEQARASNPLT
jgi:hypothetical protein